MRCVCDHGKDVLQNVRQVGLVEARCCRFVLLDVLKEFQEDLETDVGHVSHGVFEGPNDAVEDQFELGRRDVEKRNETMIIDCL